MSPLFTRSLAEETIINTVPLRLGGSADPVWPATGLDVEELERDGWSPLPFREFIVKIHSRCNLACDYCYMYEMVDQSWLNQPKTMSEQVFIDACRIIGDHVSRYSPPEIRLIFHGGEPLMVGHHTLEQFARHARRILEPYTSVRLGIQTNGALLDEEFLRICEQWQIRIGVSIDGDQQAHDRHRKYRRGTGSYAEVARGLKLINAGQRRVLSGLLCTIDVANDPVRAYEGLIRFDPPAIEFLLPHANWTTPPPLKVDDPEATPYGDWLVSVFDRWYTAPELETQVRLFNDIIEMLLGGRRPSEWVGLSPVQLAIIETDGTLEQIDVLKSAFVGATKLHITGAGNPLDQALRDPSIVARQIGADALSDTCRACRILDVCGGGNYAHRYRATTGFRNPSVYCADLQRLIYHIESRVRADLETAAE